jgi:hypothetical protein
LCRGLTPSRRKCAEDTLALLPKVEARLTEQLTKL